MEIIFRLPEKSGFKSKTHPKAQVTQNVVIRLAVWNFKNFYIFFFNENAKCYSFTLKERLVLQEGRSPKGISGVGRKNLADKNVSSINFIVGTFLSKSASSHSCEVEEATRCPGKMGLLGCKSITLMHCQEVDKHFWSLPLL